MKPVASIALSISPISLKCGTCHNSHYCAMRTMHRGANRWYTGITEYSWFHNMFQSTESVCICFWQVVYMELQVTVPSLLGFRARGSRGSVQSILEPGLRRRHSSLSGYQLSFTYMLLPSSRTWNWRTGLMQIKYKSAVLENSSLPWTRPIPKALQRPWS